MSNLKQIISLLYKFLTLVNQQNIYYVISYYEHGRSVKLSKNKVSPNTDNKETNSSEEGVKIDSETDIEAKKVDENGIEDISIEEIVEKKNKEIQDELGVSSTTISHTLRDPVSQAIIQKVLVGKLERLRSY